MHTTVIDFWFQEIDNKQWWVKDQTFDRLLEERFGRLHQQASSCELVDWRTTAQGRLAEIIILDQFSRNIHRDTTQAFACDSLALALAQEAVASGADKELVEQQRSFLYLPFMHSESPVIHTKALQLFTDLGNQTTIDFENKHKNIIDRFGRYPHRNSVLNRQSSEEEILFLQEKGSSF